MFMRCFLVAAATCFVAACTDGGPATNCDCPKTPPSCQGCPAVAQTLCIDSACLARGASDADVVADVSIARGLDGVVAVTLAVLDGRGPGCADVGVLTVAGNVLSGDRVDVSGGTFHPDLSFGSVPAGAVLVAADGLDADGEVVGRGCVEVDVIAGANDVGVVTVSR